MNELTQMQTIFKGIVEEQMKFRKDDKYFFFGVIKNEQEDGSYELETVMQPYSRFFEILYRDYIIVDVTKTENDGRVPTIKFRDW